MCCNISMGYSPFQFEAAKRNLAQSKMQMQVLKNYRLEETGRQIGKIKEVVLVLKKEKDITAPKKIIAKKCSLSKKPHTPLMKEALKLYQQKKCVQNQR